MIVSAPAAALASSTAWRNEFGPLSRAFDTMKAAAGVMDAVEPCCWQLSCALADLAPEKY